MQRIFISPIPPPDLIGLRQLTGRSRVGQIRQQIGNRPGCGARGGGAAQELDVVQPFGFERVDDVHAAQVAWHQHRDGFVRVVGQPAGQRVDHGFDFFVGRELVAHNMDASGVIGRVGLGVVGSVGCT